MEYNLDNLILLLNPYAKDNIYNLTKKLVLDDTKVIGICMADLHKLAKIFVKNGSFESILKLPHNIYYEIDMLQGLIIGYIKEPMTAKIKRLEIFVPYITNWAVCDSTVCNLKPKKKDLDLLYNFAIKNLTSKFDFTVRFSIIILMRYYETKYSEILPIINNIEFGRNYYIDMAAAWLLAEFTIKTIQMGFDEYETNPILSFVFSKNKLNEFTKKKALQKMRESYRIPDEWKKSLY